MQATITELQQQLEIQSQQNMALPHLDLGVLDEGPQSAAAREQSAALALARSRQAEVRYLRICSSCAACYPADILLPRGGRSPQTISPLWSALRVASRTCQVSARFVPLTMRCCLVHVSQVQQLLCTSAQCVPGLFLLEIVPQQCSLEPSVLHAG